MQAAQADADQDQDPVHSLISCYLAQLERQGRTAPLVDHIAYTIETWDKNAVEAELKKRGLPVRPDTAVGGALRPGEQERKIEQGRFMPAELRLEAFHPMGTARMGSDPKRSVVAPSGQTHDVPGLWVADGSLFPTSLRVNPMVTIMACARRIAAQMVSAPTARARSLAR